MINAEKEFVRPAILKALTEGDSEEVRHALLTALSVIDSHGGPTCAELCEQLGSKNWVIAKRTKRIVERYGKNVKCVTQDEYNEAQRRAIRARFPISTRHLGGAA